MPEYATGGENGTHGRSRFASAHSGRRGGGPVGALRSVLALPRARLPAGRPALRTLAPGIHARAGRPGQPHRGADSGPVPARVGAGAQPSRAASWRPRPARPRPARGVASPRRCKPLCGPRGSGHTGAGAFGRLCMAPGAGTGIAAGALPGGARGFRHWAAGECRNGQPGRGSAHVAGAGLYGPASVHSLARDRKFSRIRSRPNNAPVWEYARGDHRTEGATDGRDTDACP